MPSRFATCNEIFADQLLADVCRQVHAVGYRGLEIAPFTLAADPVTLDREERLRIRRLLTESGLEFIGLHWLLAAPVGLHATSGDKTIRERTWKYVDLFVDLCADLAQSTNGENGVVVFGSPKQRNSRDGLTSAEATRFFLDGLSRAAPHAEKRGVTILVEALSPDQCDVVTSLSEAVGIVQQIDSPALRTMFDVHNAVAETASHTDLIKQFFPYLKHVHVNELDGREPGTGAYDFASLLKCLDEMNYSGWVSLEAFDFSRDPLEIVSRSLNHLRSAPSATVPART